VDVGQFLEAFSDEVYDFYSVSPEYFGYFLVYVSLLFQQPYCKSRYGISVTRCQGTESVEDIGDCQRI
jgi:hypothetical protein